MTRLVRSLALLVVLTLVGLVLTVRSASSETPSRAGIALLIGGLVGLVRVAYVYARERRAAAKPVGPAAREQQQDLEQPWSVGEAIGVAMRALTGHFFSLFLPPLGVYVLASILSSIAVVVAGAAGVASAVVTSIQPVPRFDNSPPTSLPLVPIALLGMAVLAIVVLQRALELAFLTEASLAAVRDERVPAGRVGRASRRMLRFLAFELFLLSPAIFAVVFELLVLRYDPSAAWPAITAHVLSVLAGLAGTAMFVVFAYVPFAIDDDDLTFSAALRRSWRVTKHCLGRTVVTLLALLPIALLAVVPIVGIVGRSIIWNALAYGYVRETGRNALPWLDADYSRKAIRRYLVVVLAVFGSVFAGLAVWVTSQPAMRGSAWSVSDMILRASTIIVGVCAVIITLALLLPFGLDLLEGRKFTSFVAARHVRSQKSGFLTVISVLSILGVAMSSCSLSSVVSVMGGFSQDLKRKILGNNAHIVVDTTPGTPWENYGQALEAVRKVPGVTGATAVVHGEVMASSASNLAGVIVTGIEPNSINAVIDLQHNIEVGKLDYLVHPQALTRLPANEVIGVGPRGEHYYKGADLPGLPDDIDPQVRSVVVAKADRPGIILGRELAKTLHVYVGDEIALVSPLGDLGPMGVMPRTRRFRVAAVFYSGMYEYDATYVYTLMGEAQEYFATGDKASAIEIKVDDAERADLIAPRVISALNREDLRVRDWREINKNLFSALKLERFATFIILSVAIMVASFCIVCTLLLMVTEKGKEIAILKAVGASDGAVMRIFMIEGIIIGGIGATFGVATGLAVCTGLSWFGLRLDPEVYYIDRLPITVNAADFLTVGVAALTICALSTIYPAYAASRLRPVDGLRYE